ncbi:aldehyde dehydrogenase [Pseudoclavibacter endophyticus]|uniref:Aldehyde dehydrogenase n=1 Tax=Pseudoclavibacter endophyticus TaxID=1778590 RepID=A0A6H9WAN1_9MICO|nr:aldehyde dehydrogenase family protein [Pseudoclavibacter endophyticus]KAB1646897.1 aldehyde dehydrogenase [Pseudoclavibacter endophyticus]GGA74614.1 aldehyde dehydrogenase [Pseudoclavibacter endophyticus]
MSHNDTTTAPRPRPELFIDGRWVPAVSGETMTVIDPSTGSGIGSVAAGSAADVDAAVAAARGAFDDGRWSTLSARERSRVLLRVSGLMRERAEELAQAERLDVGKPIMFTRTIDVPNAADLFEYYATLAPHLDGRVPDTPLPAFSYTTREPRGVVAAISPFNFPLILSSSKIAPALAAGNVVVHKPAPQTPLSAQLMADILAEAGVPAGVYNLVTGEGAEPGDALVKHPGVDMVAFTGSTKVGRIVARNAGELLKPVVAELGGNAANIVFADADLEQAVGAVINAFVFNTGQFCMAGPRLLVERPVHDAIVGILEGAVGDVPLGSPSDDGTVIGPLVSADQLARVTDAVREAVGSGGRVVTGGEPIELDGGYYFQPTVIAGLPADAPAVREEVFGPVLTVQPFDTEDEAVALANSTPYGLAAGVQTGDISRAHRVAAKLDAGIVWVNGWAMLDAAVPFGGVKASGWGRENGAEALESYTRVKSVTIAVAPAPATGDGSGS